MQQNNDSDDVFGGSPAKRARQSDFLKQFALSRSDNATVSEGDDGDKPSGNLGDGGGEKSNSSVVEHSAATKGKTVLASYLLRELYDDDDFYAGLKFVTFLDDKSTELMEMIKSAEINEAEKKGLSNFVKQFCATIKENRCDYSIPHTPENLLRLARFLLPHHRAMAAEAVWGAAALKLKQLMAFLGYARIKEHALLLNFCQDVAPINELERLHITGPFNTASTCHSLGFYENRLDEDFIKEGIRQITGFIPQVDKIKSNANKALKDKLSRKYGPPEKKQTMSV